MRMHVATGDGCAMSAPICPSPSSRLLNVHSILTRCGATRRPATWRRSFLVSPSPIAVPVPPRRDEVEPTQTPRLRLTLLTVGGLLVVFTLVGAITSTFYYISLGLSGQFQTESLLTWPIWGLRALLAPLVLGGGGTAVALVLLTVLYRQVFMAIGSLKSAIDPIALRVSRVVQSILEVPTATTAALLFLAQSALLVLTWWWFSDLLNGFDSLIVQAPRGDLTVLSTANAEYQKLFRKVVSVEFIVMSAAWLGLLWMRTQRKDRRGGSVLQVEPLPRSSP